MRVIDGRGAESSSAVAATDAGTPSPVGDVEAAAGPSAAGARHAHRLADLADDELVALAQQGEAAACEALYRRHAGYCVNLAIRIAGSSRDAEDVVHDAFLRAFQGLAELRNRKAFRSWLGSIVVHGMRSRLRRQRFVRLFGLGQSSDPIDLESIASPQAPPAARAQLAQIYALLQTLPLDVRIAWTLRHVEGHDLREAAELAGCSLATVKRRIRAAQSYLEEHFVDSSPREIEP
ncbi:MAG: RNA polymerase sigma factor [Deltaproteobacteria bacterium]|nr:RNA polymerase sigma factor [Deltaproteobacteria bacterium]MBW2532261.1 RNA polymerase sigma factor [Deltaproteobacteria bacterium]